MNLWLCIFYCLAAPETCFMQLRYLGMDLKIKKHENDHSTTKTLRLKLQNMCVNLVFRQTTGLAPAV